MPLYMLDRSMLLGKLLALDLPLSAGAYFDKLQDQRLEHFWFSRSSLEWLGL